MQTLEIEKVPSKSVIIRKPHWVGNILISKGRGCHYIHLVKDKFGLLGIIGGSVEAGETIEMAALRETNEKAHQKVFVRNLKPIWEGTTEDLKIKTYTCNFSVFITEVPYFKSKKIEDDPDIVEIVTFPLFIFLRSMLSKHKMAEFKNKDFRILKGIKSTLQKI